jgi:ABC-type Fe3+ transport system permease subunit
MISRDSWVTFLTCLGTGLVVFGDTIHYPEVHGQGFGQGPAFYPQLLGGTLVVLSLLVILQDLVRGRQTVLQTGIPLEDQPKPRYLQIVKIMVLSIIFVLVMKYLGFFVSGFLLTILTVLLIRGSVHKRHLAIDLIFSIGIIILVYLVFEVFVGIQLPNSIFFD